jgi:hypothetical protein
VSEGEEKTRTSRSFELHPQKHCASLPSRKSCIGLQIASRLHFKSPPNFFLRFEGFLQQFQQIFGEFRGIRSFGVVIEALYQGN